MIPMKYSFVCPAPCNYGVTVDAKNADEATGKIMMESTAHAERVHPDLPQMTMEQLSSMVRSGMTKAQSTARAFVGAVLAFWLVLVFSLGSQGAFVRPQEAPPFPILLGVTVPLVVFLVAYLGSGAFRALILSADMRVLTAIQAWRTGGLGFLALYANGILPGLFAWPAGLGDIGQFEDPRDVRSLHVPVVSYDLIKPVGQTIHQNPFLLPHNRNICRQDRKEHDSFI